MRVKIFNGNNTDALEKEINQWLTAHLSISIREILQTESFDAVWSLTITIFY